MLKFLIGCRSSGVVRKTGGLILGSTCPWASTSNVLYMPIPVGVIHGLKTCSSRSEEEETHTSPPHFPLKLFNNRPVLCTHYMITQTLKHNHLVVSAQAACIIMSHIC